MEQTADAVREHAATMEVDAFDFLDHSGKVGAQGSAVASVRVKFIDGEVATLPLREFRKLDKVCFKLRPVRLHG